jgi:hypothetical protein
LVVQRRLSKILISAVIAGVCFFAPRSADAQIKTGGEFISNAPPAAGTMKSANQADTLSYGDDTAAVRPQYSLRRYFKALAHKDTMSISYMFLGQAIVPGTGQLYNKQAWKIPIVYGAIGGCIGGAVMANMKWKKDGKQSAKDLRNYLVLGAIGSYWGSLMDATVSYKSYERPLPAKASFYSALLPGLGQAYNGDYWHIPIYYAGFMISGYCWAFNQKEYRRYKNMYIDKAAGTYTGSLSSDDIIWYRDQYRRNRDYSVIATMLIYALNIIDANVFAHFSHFDISDDLSFNVQPVIIQEGAPLPVPAQTFYGFNSGYSSTKIGFQMNINF